ncbi:MAG TPA: hypothetical protein VK936_13325 [Longimicrobiales bacterium]|nr:hypothetical protein [Longimicrobiales bacterium]
MPGTTHPETLAAGPWHFRSMATVAASWSLAGGIAGGMLAAGFVAAGRLHPDGAIIITLVLASMGSVLGILHGAVLGHLARARSDPYTWPETTVGVMAAAAGLVVANVLSQWLVLAALLARAGARTGWIYLAVLVPLCLGIVAWATFLGWHKLEAAYARWPEHRIGSWLVAGVFLVVSGVFLVLRPAIPGTELQLSWWATLIVAAVATLWIAAPAVIAGLRYRHGSRPADR